MTQEQLDYTQEYHDLPSGWEWVRLGSICDAINGRAFKSTEWRDAGLPIIRIQNLKAPGAPFNYFQGELKDQHRVASGDLLFAWSGTPGTSFGAHIWKGPNAALNQHIFNIRFDRNSIDPKYFLYALNQNVTRYVEQAQGGVGLAHITKNKFLASSIPLAPLDQQKRIVAELEKQFSRLDEAVANLKRVKANLKRYKAAVLKAAVEGKLTEEWRRAHPDVEPASKLLDRILTERRAKWEEAELAKMKAKGKAPKNDKWKAKYKEPAAPDTNDLPELPERWVWATVESLSMKVTDGVHKKPRYVAEGIPFVTVKNLTTGDGISFDALNYVSPEDHAEFCQRTHPERGDILISKDGTLGVVRLIETDKVFSIFVSVALVKPVLHDVSRYLVTALQSPVVQRQMVPKGSGLQHIHLEDLRADCIPVPPLAEQRYIVAEVARRLSHIRGTAAQVDVNLHRAERMRQALLFSLFTGQMATCIREQFA